VKRDTEPSKRDSETEESRPGIRGLGLRVRRVKGAALPQARGKGPRARGKRFKVRGTEYNNEG